MLIYVLLNIKIIISYKRILKICKSEQV
jgi:hypothetical protein